MRRIKPFFYDCIHAEEISGVIAGLDTATGVIIESLEDIDVMTKDTKTSQDVPFKVSKYKLSNVTFLNQ